MAFRNEPEIRESERQAFIEQLFLEVPNIPRRLETLQDDYKSEFIRAKSRHAYILRLKGFRKGFRSIINDYRLHADWIHDRLLWSLHDRAEGAFREPISSKPSGLVIVLYTAGPDDFAFRGWDYLEESFDEYQKAVEQKLMDYRDHCEAEAKAAGFKDRRGRPREVEHFKWAVWRIALGMSKQEILNKIAEQDPSGNGGISDAALRKAFRHFKEIGIPIP